MVVAKSFTQKHGFDFFETFNPIIKQVTIRIVITIALSRKWKMHKLDIKNTFLNGELQEKLYMAQS